MKRYRKPHMYKRRKSIFRSRFFWLGFLILIFVISLLYFLFLSQTFQIEKVIVTGEEKVSKEEIKLIVEEKLGNKILFFPTKTIFLADLSSTRKEILNKFPQIAEVELKRGFPDAINVLVIERLRIANWCQEGNCFLLDNEGVIFERSPVREDLIKIVDLQKTFPNYLGEKVIDKEDLTEVLDISPQLKIDLEIPIKEFTINSKDKLTVVTMEGWEIYFNLQKDTNWQLTKLRAVLDEKIPPERRNDLEYIELRFGNFAPFKYKD